jgi:hypothetical protein
MRTLPFHLFEHGNKMEFWLSIPKIFLTNLPRKLSGDDNVNVENLLLSKPENFYSNLASGGTNDNDNVDDPEERGTANGQIQNNKNVDNYGHNVDNDGTNDVGEEEMESGDIDGGEIDIAGDQVDEIDGPADQVDETDGPTDLVDETDGPTDQVDETDGDGVSPPAPTPAPLRTPEPTQETVSTAAPAPTPAPVRTPEPTQETVSTAVPTPVPTPAPVRTPEPTPGVTKSPTQNPTKTPTMQPTSEAFGDKVKEEEEKIKQLANDKTAEVMAGFIAVFGIVGMILTAWQLFENPDGLCASCCRLSVKASKFLVKICCLPCKLCCGRYSGYTSSDPKNRTLFVEEYTNDLELT